MPQERTDLYSFQIPKSMFKGNWSTKVFVYLVEKDIVGITSRTYVTWASKPVFNTDLVDDRFDSFLVEIPRDFMYSTNADILSLYDRNVETDIILLNFK